MLFYHRCAAHLNMLCEGAIDAMHKHGHVNGVQRGVFVDYAGLPGAIPRVMLPLFGVDDVESSWLENMVKNSEFYSKGGRVSKPLIFEGDSKTKEDEATKDIKRAANGLLQESFTKLSELALATVPAVLSKAAEKVPAAAARNSLITEKISKLSSIDSMWEKLKSFPKKEEEVAE